MRMILSAGVIIVSAALAGCGASPDKQASANGEKFEVTKDPAVKPETHFAAGQFAESQNNAPQAIEQYRAAVKLRADYQPALYRLGVLCTQMKMWPDAVAAWKGYIKATGEAAGGYSNLGFTYQLSGDDQAAEAAYKTGIAKDDRNRPCRVNYGLLLARQGKYDSAIAQWQVVLTPAEVHYNLGSVYEQRKETAQARVEYQKALELDPSLGDAKGRLAQLGKE